LTKRLGLLFLFVALAFGGWRVFLSLGHLLHNEDPLAKADVIYVLGGTRVERVAEAGELYREGWAPRILLSRQVSEPAEVHLRSQGLHIPTETQLQRDVLHQMGVPPEAIDEVRSEQVATANEVEELATVATARQWTRLIVVTSKLHTARSALAMRRRFEPINKTIIMRASRYDTTDVARWWSNRSTFRFVLFEAQKFAAYAIGVGD
jgi:uncharacterized SAM-binding protein YcdF (DUF218 family)